MARPIDIDRQRIVAKSTSGIRPTIQQNLRIRPPIKHRKKHRIRDKKPKTAITATSPTRSNNKANKLHIQVLNININTSYK